MAKESRFNKKFREEMESRGMKIYRVESHATCPGIPDNHYIVRDVPGAVGWMEIKEEDKEPSKIAYRPAQVPWMVEYANNGGKVWTVLHIRQRKVIVLLFGDACMTAAVDFSKANALFVSTDWDDAWGDVHKLLVVFPLNQPRKRL